MDYLEFETEDFLLDASFQHYCLRSDDEDVRFWEAWIAANPHKKKEVEAARALYFILNGNNDATAFGENRRVFRKALEAHLAAGGQPRQSKSIPRVRRLAFAAAAAACVLGFLLLHTVHRTQDPSPPAAPPPVARVLMSKRGEQRSFTLPDGSQVQLNAGSTLTLSPSFGGKDREMSLSGEALFDVTHDASRPFLIHTSAMDVRVLGTQLNIRAYAGDPVTETSLIKGSVEVVLRNGSHTRILLHPNEKVVCETPAAPASGRAMTAHTMTEHYKVAPVTIDSRDSTGAEWSWAKDKLFFNDNSLGEIAAAIERRYDVTIQFKDSSVMQYRYTGTFRDQSVTQVLDALQLSWFFHYRRENGNTIIIDK